MPDLCRDKPSLATFNCSTCTLRAEWKLTERPTGEKKLSGTMLSCHCCLLFFTKKKFMTHEARHPGTIMARPTNYQVVMRLQSWSSNCNLRCPDAMNTFMLEHGIPYGQFMMSTVVQKQNTTCLQIGGLSVNCQNEHWSTQVE